LQCLLSLDINNFIESNLSRDPISPFFIWAIQRLEICSKSCDNHQATERFFLEPQKKVVDKKYWEFIKHIARNRVKETLWLYCVCVYKKPEVGKPFKLLEIEQV